MIRGLVVRGHGVASGSSGDPRFPDGTLRLQFPIFASLGLDLDGIFPGTINLDIAPARYEIVSPRLTLTNIHWHPDCPAETFSFFDCEIAAPGDDPRTPALIYLPHPETKPEHFQAPSVLEILAPKRPALHYGQALELSPDPEQLRLISP
jgi:hypothetical protein